MVGVKDGCPGALVPAQIHELDQMLNPMCSVGLRDEIQGPARVLYISWVCTLGRGWHGRTTSCNQYLVKVSKYAGHYASQCYVDRNKHVLVHLPSASMFFSTGNAGIYSINCLFEPFL